MKLIKPQLHEVFERKHLSCLVLKLDKFFLQWLVISDYQFVLHLLHILNHYRQRLKHISLDDFHLRADTLDLLQMSFELLT